MTDFRPVRRLLAYSGGTVPDSDRIHYSPPVPKAKPAALERYMNLPISYTRKTGLSIIKSAKRLDVPVRSCAVFGFLTQPPAASTILPFDAIYDPFSRKLAVGFSNRTGVSGKVL